MCKSVLIAGIAAALSIAAGAAAQTARLDVQVSTDNMNWSDTLFAPAGSDVYVRVVASTTAPNAVGLASVTYQPTLSGWTSADTRMFFSSSIGASAFNNSGLPANMGRMTPYGAASMNLSSVPGLLVSFNDPGGILRIAGSRASSMTTNLDYGVVSNQNPKVSYPTYDQSNTAVILRYGVRLSSSPLLRTMVADIPIAGVKGAKTTWYTSLTVSSGNPIDIPLTQADIHSATLHVGPPNTAPTAVDDVFNMLEDQSLFVTTGSVLNNDTDPDADESKTATLVASTAHGTLDFHDDGTFSYIPAPDFNGVDIFTYRVLDRYSAASNVGTVTINVADVNDEPILTANDPPATLEDSGQRTITGWANFNAGNGENQGVADYEIMSIGNPNLFAMGGWPSVSNDGTLRFTPATNASGVATFEVRVRDTGGTNNGGVDMSESHTYTVVILPVNDAPVVTASPVAPVLEDAGQQSISHWASFNPGPGEAEQILLGYQVSSVSNPALFSVQPTIAPDGTLVYTPAPNASGSSTFTITARDSGGTDNGGVDTSTPQTFTITVQPVNDAPTFAAVNPAAVNEDASAQTVSSWAAFSAGAGTTESSQVVSGYIVSNVSNPALFAAGPVVSASGALTYTPAPNAFGTATFTVQVRDNGGTANGGVDTSAPQTFTITINPINDAPTFAAATSVAVNEDQGPQSLAAWAQFNPGPNEVGQTVLTYTISNLTNTALFSGIPTVANDGTLSFTTAANASGSASFQLRVRDNGGTASGGIDTSAPQTITISVTAVNDAPAVSVASIPTIMEDSGPKTVFGFASFNPGPGESTQSLLGYTVADISNPAMFSAGPSVANNGTLTYTPSPNASGSVTFTVVARDNGGTANGGVDTSTPVTATINITNVNDAPTFAAANPPASNEDAGTVSVGGWSTFNPGPFENGQTAEYTVTGVTNPSLFAAGGLPAVGADGTLTYTTAANVSGSSQFSVRVRDNGGTANGGVDTSLPQTFTVSINVVNDPPAVSLGTIPGINEDSGPQVVPSFAAFSPGPGESGQSLLEYVVSGVSNPAAFTVPPAINNAGTLTYTPAPDASGTISFTVRARDNGGTDNGGVDLSQPVTATMNITGVNDPPVAVARNLTLDARTGCVSLLLTPAQLDNGSYDPDNGPSELTLRINRTGEFPVGVTPVVLTVSDPDGLTSTASATVTVLAQDSNHNGIPDSCDLIRGGGGPDCDGDGDFDESQCVWDNGSAAPMQSTLNGQLSQYGGTVAAKVADDFYLPPGLLYRITGFRGQILTNSIERTARLEFYRDCDGAPAGEPFAVFESSNVASETQGDNGKMLITYVFEFCEDKLVLDGGEQYWVSLQGKVNCNTTDQAFWAIVGVEGDPHDMIGSVPYKALGVGDHPCTVTGYEPWESIADCCIGCANMAYSMTGSFCQLIWNNGDVDLGPERGGDPSGINRGIFSRAADNIVVKPCRTEEICWVEAYIWTNCTPVFGFLEVYDNDCKLPGGTAYRYRAVPTDVIELDQHATIEGVEYRLVKLEFWNIPWTLTGGQNYWFSVGADGAGSFNARSFFAYAMPTSFCGCQDIHLTPGAKLANRQSDTRWLSGNREYAFRIATKAFYTDAIVTSIPPSRSCEQDINEDGVVSIQDVFSFLQAWFAGCP